MLKKLRKFRRKRNLLSKGFTMVELLVVIAVIGILLLFAVPNFGRLFWERTRSSVNEIAQELRKYRERALARNLEYQITFDVANNQYTVTIMTTPPEIIGPFTIQYPTKFGGPGGMVVPPEAPTGSSANGVQINGGGNTLVFTRNGGSNGGAIYFTNGRDFYAIGIFRTGRIKVWKWTGNNWY